MGFFSFIEDAIDWVAEKASDVVNFVRDKVSTVIDTFNDEISSEDSYDIEEANIDMTERLNKVLIEFSEEYMKTAVRIEDTCIKSVEQYYEDFISVVEKSEVIGCSKSIAKKVKLNESKMRNLIKHSISYSLKRRMSLDDSECLKILKMESGTEKKKNMSDFVEKVIGEALDNLSNTVRESLDMQLEELEVRFMEIAEKQDKKYSNLKKYMEKFSVINENEIEEREKNCVFPLLILQASEEILHLIA